MVTAVILNNNHDHSEDPQELPASAFDQHHEFSHGGLS